MSCSKTIINVIEKDTAIKENGPLRIMFSLNILKICIFALFLLIFPIKIFANDRESAITQLREVLFEGFPVNENREKIDLCFQRFISSNYSDSKSSFYSAGERAYWETLKYPGLWQELCMSLDRELVDFRAMGNVSDELRFTIVQLYFFGRLEYRPIFLSDGKGIDIEDTKLNFSAAIGPAIEVSRFIRQTGARKVFEVFSGRGNMTILLSLAGFESLITVERDTHLDIERSWKKAIDKLLEDIPSVFWPKVTKPLFLNGDILEIDLPLADCVIIDPPYGYASSCNATTNKAFSFFFDVLVRLQEGSFQKIYSLVPAQWVSIIPVFTEKSESIDIQKSITEILQKSVYYQKKPEKWTPFIEAVKDDVYVENLKQKLERIQGILSAKRTPIQNVLGKELDIFQIHHHKGDWTRS
jgi:hypothetical protein